MPPIRILIADDHRLFRDGLHGLLDAMREILAANPQIGILILTMFEDDDSVFAAMRAGAQGYLLKAAGHEELVRAIHGVSNGEAIFGPGIARRVISFFAE